MKHTKFIVFLIATFMISGVWYIDRVEYQETVELDRVSLVDYTQITASSLTAEINIRLQLPRLLSAIVGTSPSFATTNFDSIATGLIGNLKGIISLQLAPNGIVTHVTDIPRNRAAIGYNILTDEKTKGDAIRSIEERVPVISGPLVLRQGGTALIARLPVFTNDQYKESF